MALSGKLPEAYEDYTRAIGLNPSFGEAYYNRGLVQIYLKDTRKGCIDMSKAGGAGRFGGLQGVEIYGQRRGSDAGAVEPRIVSRREERLLTNSAIKNDRNSTEKDFRIGGGAVDRAGAGFLYDAHGLYRART